MNSVTVSGRLARDVEIRSTQNGKQVGNFAVAVERDYKSENGDRPVDFIDCVAWGKSAEFAQSYLRKGNRAIINGKLQQRNWQDQEGKKRSKHEIQVSSMEPIDWPNNQSDQFEGEEATISKEDIPF